MAGELGEQRPAPIVELVRDLQRRVGSTAKIEFAPWAHCLHAAQFEPGVMIFPTTRSPEREALFLWVGPINEIHSQFFAKSGSPAVDDPRKAMAIGVVHGSALEAELQRRGFTNIDPGKNQTLVLRKLLAGRDSLIAEFASTVQKTLRETGHPANSVVAVGDFMPSRGYFAFSMGTSNAVIDRWQAALDASKADGAFDRLYASRLKD